LEQIGFAACISEPEAAEMRDLAPKTQVHVIPPGVDCDYFRPLANVARRLSLVFVGRLSYRPNAEAVLRIATRILPRVKADCPDATFVAVGSDPPPDVLRLRRHDGVEVTGRVPDVRPYLARGAVSVAPMSLGGGLRLKVLEALAMETPVVTTRLGAKGLQVEDGLNITLAEDDDAAIARACVQLLASPAERHRRGIAGREFVLRGYSLARQAEALGSFHAAAVAGAVDKTS
jgi:glycosyltransferase involved in cell wall biosynthesis